MVEQKSIKKQMLSKKVFSLNGIVKVGLLSAIAFVLMLLEFPMPLFPAFLKMDISDLPALIGGFALGPMAAVIIEFIKNVFHIIFKNDGTGGVGNLANFIVGISFAVPAAIVYIRNKTRKNAVIGMALGTLLLVIFSALANYYVLIPFYTKLYFEGNLENLLAVMAMANKNITDVALYVLYAVMPFNLIKAFVISLITLLIYKRVSPILQK
ncbi:MAG TPA: ECF transporter S component [Clostridia bacterium]|nr:ECF transporter S component [Clostridia bacterium]